MKQLLVIAALCVAAAVAHRPPGVSPCTMGGMCTAEELERMPHAKLIALVSRLQGTPLADLSEPARKTKDSLPKWPYIWPHPHTYTNGTKRLWLYSTNWEWLGPLVSDMSSAFRRYQPLTFPHTTAGEPTGKPAAKTFEVTVKDLGADLQAGTDESYVLIIPDDGSDITVQAPTIYGAYHAMETFSQLVQFDYDVGQYYIPAAPWKISDRPRFTHREILLDSSRHFLPIPTMKAIIDAMTFTKLNTLHWHMVDSQSFPVELPNFPNLAAKGAYSNMERYSAQDVRDLVAYAKERGVRVVPELDMPGHAESWCPGDMSLCPSSTCRSPLNVARDETFEKVAAMQKDIADLFNDKMMHLGGDEVDTGCWTRTPEVAQWLEQHHMSANDAYLYFIQKVHASARAAERDAIGWEEIWNFFGTGLDQNTIIHQWLPNSQVAPNATAHGYRVLWSTSSAWYLDWLGVSWKTMYSQEPCNGIPDAACDKFVLGGGGEMWGETVDTSDIQATIFPRAAAIAERLWSPRTITDIDAAAERFAWMRCFLNSRGVGAAPVNNANARTAPPGPGSCRQ